MANSQKKIVKNVTITLVVLVVIWFLIGNYFYHQALHFNTKKTQFGLEYQKEQKRYDIARLDTLKQQKFEIQSPNGYPLSTLYVENYEKTDTTVILVHGLSSNKYMMLPYADMFLDMHYNVLMFDMANHGESGGDAVKYGYTEKDDLGAVTEWVVNQNPDVKLIYWGESLGASTILQFAPFQNFRDNTLTYIVDSPYSDLYDMFEFRLKEDFGLPNLLFIESMTVISSIRDDFSVFDVKPYEAVKDINLPIFFIHSSFDPYTPVSMTEKMKKISPVGSSVWYADNEGHALTFFNDKKEYAHQINLFLTPRVRNNSDTQQ